MSKANNLTDFLTDVANAIRTKKGSDELINPQDFSNEILNLPSGGDGTLPITIPTITSISFSEPNLTITPGDYSDLEEYNPTFSYIITFNGDETVEYTNLTNDVINYLNDGLNTVSIVAKSTISVSESQENIAYSEAYVGTISLVDTYLNLKDDFDHDVNLLAYWTITYSNDDTTMEFKKSQMYNIYMKMPYLLPVSNYTKVKFQAKGNGAQAPKIELQTSDDNANFTTFETVSLNHQYDFSNYEFNLPSGATYFRFYLDLISSNYDPSITLQNVVFKR